MVPTLLGCLLTFGLFVPAHAQQDLAALEHAAAARPSDVESRRRLADGYSAAPRLLDAAAELRKVTDLAPKSTICAKTPHGDSCSSPTGCWRTVSSPTRSRCIAASSIGSRRWSPFTIRSRASTSGRITMTGR